MKETCYCVGFFCPGYECKKNAAEPRFFISFEKAESINLSSCTAGQEAHYSVADSTRTGSTEQTTDDLLGVN